LTAAEIDRRAQELYENRIRTVVEPGNRGRYIAIDVESGDYEVGDERLAIAKSHRIRQPGATIGMLRIGYPAVGRMGGRVKALNARFEARSGEVAARSSLSTPRATLASA
jgi:hypothetical protein